MQRHEDTRTIDKNRPETVDNRNTTDIIIGIPAYNEGPRIGSTVLGAKQHADDVVVVDDGSTDETAVRAKQAGATVVSHELNRGKGSAIRTLLQYAQSVDCDALVLIDGDGQHRTEDIPRVIRPVVSGEADVAIGSRYLESVPHDTPRYRRFGQRVLDFLTREMTGADLTDSQSGFRALSPTAIREMTIRTDGIGVESEMIGTATEHDLEIAECPIQVRYKGIDGQTLDPISHSLSVILLVLRRIYDRKPGLFLGIFGGLVLLLAGAYSKYRVHRNPEPRRVAGYFAGGFSTGIAVVLGLEHRRTRKDSAEGLEAR